MREGSVRTKTLWEIGCQPPEGSDCRSKHKPAAAVAAAAAAAAAAARDTSLLLHFSLDYCTIIIVFSLLHSLLFS